ncbi:MAG: hypothetical protein ABIG20_02960 [archaeon]
MVKPDITDKKLFLKYAIPCSSTLVRRGDVKQARIDELREWVLTNQSAGQLSEPSEPTSQELHDIFKVASVMCCVAADDLGKAEIDAEVIREYFINRHDEAVEQRWLLKQDFDKEACKTRVVEFDESFNKEFCPDAKSGDKVVLHYNYIIEKLSEQK